MCDSGIKIKIGDQVKETDGYRQFCRDRDVRGEVVAIRDNIVDVRDPYGWTCNIHHSWLEINNDSIKKFIPKTWFKPQQKFCQHCGEKL